MDSCKRLSSPLPSETIGNTASIQEDLYSDRTIRCADRNFHVYRFARELRSLINHSFVLMGKIYIDRSGCARGREMYQKWKSPPFSVEQLIGICRDFFEAQNFPLALQMMRPDRSILNVQITPVNAVQTLRIERKGKVIRLTCLPLSHASDGLGRLGGLLGTDRVLKNETQEQLFLDRIEQQFWDNLDRRLPEIAAAADHLEK